MSLSHHSPSWQRLPESCWQHKEWRSRLQFSSVCYEFWLTANFPVDPTRYLAMESLEWKMLMLLPSSPRRFFAPLRSQWEMSDKHLSSPVD